MQGEATSALDEDAKAAMLSLFDQELTGASVLSIGIDPCLGVFHSRTLHIGVVLLARSSECTRSGRSWITSLKERLGQTRVYRQRLSALSAAKIFVRSAAGQDRRLIMLVAEEVAMFRTATAMIMSVLLITGAASQPQPLADQHLTWAQTRTHPTEPDETGSVITQDEVLVDVTGRRCSRFSDARNSAERCVGVVSSPRRGE
jgi:hypothetical protein